ncbi:MAG TPA: hypothetical protein VEU08_17205 [Vicinamibacterales bacterium]|nr:hypothetical protein [Vicinamibacterales bacterium]
MTALDFATGVLYAIVAAIVIVNLQTLCGIAHESWLWLQEALPSSRRRRIRRFVSRLRRQSAPPSTVIAVSERERLNVVVRISDHLQKARVH